MLNEGRMNSMLLRFRFKNYKSFYDEAVLDMTAANIKEHTNSLIEVNGNKVLPVAAIYGANASGKSNVFKAFFAMADEVTQSYKRDEKHYLMEPYVFNTYSIKNPCEFEICINIKGKEYRYGFVRDQVKVYKEWLFERKFAKNTQAKEKCVFYRDTDLKKLTTDSIPVKEKKELDYVHSMTDDACLMVTDIGKREKSQYSKIYNWFLLTAQLQDYSDDSDQNFSTDIVKSVSYNDISFLNDVIGLLNKFDDSIIDINIVKEKGLDSEDRYKVFTKHACKGKDDEWFPIENESGGTKKIFAFAFWLLTALQYGWVLFIDELDTKLHPLVLRHIVKMFTDKEINTGSGQLIFSAHNLICLDSSDLRRDEIWFVEKNNQKSTLYSLYDFKEDDCNIRSDLSFGKNYLSGRFGAIPFQNQV
jgi:AAA15 family ATPase/GTPase